MSRFVSSYILATDQQTRSGHESPLTHHNYPSATSITNWSGTIACECLVGQSLGRSWWKTTVRDVWSTRGHSRMWQSKQCFEDWGTKGWIGARFCKIIESFLPQKFWRTTLWFVLVKGARKWMTNGDAWHATLINIWNPIDTWHPINKLSSFDKTLALTDLRFRQ